ncbi:MAG: ABC transporter permease [Spirochaetia bacterium]|nr:ABC transporter permease [Spirochaetia bacterium]NCC89793.1 ABC transporter permease [Spirochaetia bacterium]
MKKLLHCHETYVLAIILVFSLVITSINPNFLTLENAFDMLKSNSFIGILAIGVLVVLIAGGIDISFAATATIAEYVTMLLCLRIGGSMLFAFVAAVCMGVLLGSLNGYLVDRFSIPPIITTIATMNLYYGLLMVFTKGKWIYALPPYFRSFADIRVLTLYSEQGTPYGISIITVMWVVLMILSSLFLQYTRLGRCLYALGGDEIGARRIGIPVRWVKVFVYSFMGAMAAVAGIVQALLVQTVAPNSIVGKELNVIAAVVLGGASLSGGVGSVFGMFLGVMLLAIVQNGMTLMKVPAVWYDVFVGLVVIVSVGFSSWKTKHAVVSSPIAIQDIPSQVQEA